MPNAIAVYCDMIADRRHSLRTVVRAARIETGSSRPLRGREPQVTSGTKSVYGTLVKNELGERGPISAA
jgi:hypothetical protein